MEQKQAEGKLLTLVNFNTLSSIVLKPKRLIASIHVDWFYRNVINHFTMEV